MLFENITKETIYEYDYLPRNTIYANLTEPAILHFIDAVNLGERERVYRIKTHEKNYY